MPKKGGDSSEIYISKNVETVTLPLGASVLQRITITQWSSSGLVLASTGNFPVPLQVYTYFQSSTEMQYVFFIKEGA